MMDEVNQAANHSGPRYERLRRIATYQRWVLFALLSSVVINVTIRMDLIPDDSPLDMVES